MDSTNQKGKIVSTSKPAFSKGQIDYMKVVENLNLERVQKLKRIKRNNFITGSVLGGFVLGIYAYSIFSVKQEHFLDDFIEPTTVHKET